MKPNYFDIHSHIQEKEFDKDREEVIGRMRENKVWSCIVGVDYKSSKQAVEIATLWEGLFAVVGLHPTDTVSEEFDDKKYGTLIQSDKVVAIGECGFDYFRLKGDLETEKTRQKSIFEAQVALALEHDIPLMLHCRPTQGTMDAYEDVLDILESYTKTYGSKLRGDVHFFVGDVDIARRFLTIGFTLSFTGVLTFASDYDEVVKYAPLDMIMSETDCPFVAPVPHRGERNEPVYVMEVVKRIAEIRGEDFEKVRGVLVDNVMRVFNIPYAA